MKLNYEGTSLNEKFRINLSIPKKEKFETNEDLVVLGNNTTQVQDQKNENDWWKKQEHKQNIPWLRCNFCGKHIR